jgi:hypothetical protein
MAGLHTAISSWTVMYTLHNDCRITIYVDITLILLYTWSVISDQLLEYRFVLKYSRGPVQTFDLSSS